MSKITFIPREQVERIANSIIPANLGPTAESVNQIMQNDILETVDSSIWY